jgi:hypothetical protein
MYRIMISALIALGLCVAGFIPAGPAVFAADPVQALEKPSFHPKFIHAGIPAEVSVRAFIGRDPAIDPASVNLLRVDEYGRKTIVDRLYDDGTHGDAAPNDGLFICPLILNEPQPTTLKFQVSAGYKGQLKQTLSDIATLEVRPNPKFEELWSGFLTKIVAKDLEGALGYFREERRAEYRRLYEKVGMEKLARVFGVAKDFARVSVAGYRAEYSFMAVSTTGEPRSGIASFWLERDGVWRMDVVGF